VVVACCHGRAKFDHVLVGIHRLGSERSYR